MTKKKIFVLILVLGTLFMRKVVSPALVQAQNPCIYTVGASETYTEIGKPGTADPKDVLDIPGVNWAGKTICIKANKVYKDVRIFVGGTLNAPLVIRSHPQNYTPPSIKNTDPYNVDTKFDGALTVGASHVEVQEMMITGSPGSGIKVSASNVKLKNVYIFNTYNSGIKINNSNQRINNIQVDGCSINKATLAGSRACNDDPVCDAVNHSVSEQLHIINSDNVLVQNCRIYDGDSIRGGTIGILESTHVTLRNNEVYDSEGNMTHIDQGQDILITNNLLYDTCSEDNRSNGLYVHDEKPTQLPVSKNITFSNNIIVGAKSGIVLGDCEPEPQFPANKCDFTNVEISNNTVVGSAEGYALRISNRNVVSNMVVKNNIFHRKNAQAQNNQTGLNQNGADVQFLNNIWAFQLGLASSDQQISGLSGVFTQALNPEQCINDPLDPMKYQVSNPYSGIGADASLVGRKINLPIIDPPDDDDTMPGDTNGDGSVGVADVNAVINGFGTQYTIFDYNMVVKNIAN